MFLGLHINLVNTHFLCAIREQCPTFFPLSFVNIVSTLNNTHVCRNLGPCPRIWSLHIHGSFTLVVTEIARPEESRSFVCFISWHSSCYLNLFLNVLNMRTDLPLGEVRKAIFSKFRRRPLLRHVRRNVSVGPREVRKAFPLCLMLCDTQGRQKDSPLP